jgi:hypothetical protein
VADRERLAGAAEDHLLVRHQAGQADRVDRLVDVGASLAEQVRGVRRGSRRGVQLAVVVQLDDLALRQMCGGLPCELHHQDRADGEVGSDEEISGAYSFKAREVGATRSYHAMHAGLQAGPRVVGRGARGREVDHHVGVAEHVDQRGIQQGIGAAHERHVVGLLHRFANRLAHAARGAGDRDAYQAASAS